MATQKQRRKRAKEQRHQYDLVEIDAEGNETVLSGSDLKSETSATPRPKPGDAKGGSKRTRAPRGTAQPPTWGRVLKRGAIFAPIFLATVMLLGRGRLTLAGAIVQTMFLLAIFVPFSYFMDRMVWRSHEKRLGKAKSAGR